MGRGDKQKGKGNLPNRELYERMNFLYQSSQFFSQLLPSSSSNVQTADNDSSNLKLAQQHQQQKSLLPISRFYSKEMRQVARKSVLRLSPHVKREICKACASPLVPGVSSTVRIKGHNRGRRVVTTCNCCGWQRRLIVDPGHELFIDKEEHGTLH
ncbi:Ribonuclease P protein subunit p21 [Coemansia spiralis]|uniref:Ribonuclease P protein subunit p21 n=2 Tax=Coemansia TaxID=4863 RepID=A0A9W8G1P1_9FUNG|nr:RNAse P Rpr2/Rpp21/SNM1 subunit domain-containing protein [Coemansia spiralis]KAJ1996134.1 Ribonuclease P protein subunit p21 [Coemansia umbellata]KAJ2626109.1 Ribonuclease P protein subunit p21 [Coemansia sp. RSA 1358]KAJ2676250.1 Ribonuclease P protein subunit p21 [Coemansia spiralis]